MKIRGALLLMLLVTGCGFFSKSKSTVYTIEKIPGTALTRTGTPVGIDVVELPPGLDRREVVVRQPEHKLDIRGNELWSASLEEMVLHTLAFDLASRLPEGMVILPGQVKPATNVRGIDVVVEDFAAGPENRVVLNARWILRENGRADVTHREQIAIDVPSLTSANVATGFSQALAALADRIAPQL